MTDKRTPRSLPGTKPPAPHWEKLSGGGGGISRHSDAYLSQA